VKGVDLAALTREFISQWKLKRKTYKCSTPLIDFDSEVQGQKYKIFRKMMSSTIDTPNWISRPLPTEGLLSRIYQLQETKLVALRREYDRLHSHFIWIRTHTRSLIVAWESIIAECKREPEGELARVFYAWTASQLDDEEAKAFVEGVKPYHEPFVDYEIKLVGDMCGGKEERDPRVNRRKAAVLEEIITAETLEQGLELTDRVKYTIKRYAAYLETVERGAPLNPGKGGYPVGRLNSQFGKRPYKLRGYEPIPYEFTIKSHPEELLEFSAGAKNLVFPGWTTTRPVLQEFCDRETRLPTGGFKDCIAALEVSGDELHIPSVSPPKRENLANIRINPRASPGYPYDYKDGKRADTFTAAALHSSLLYDRSVAGYSNPAIWKVGGREKVATEEVGKTISARPIWMPGYAEMNLDSSLAQPLGDLLKYTEGELYLGFSGVHNTNKRLYNAMTSGPFVKASDFSKYDSTVPETLIVAAFGIVYSAYAKGLGVREKEKVMNLVLDACGRFVFKYLVTPGGYVYRVVGGTPSGSPFTSIVNSLCNWLAQRSTVNRLEPVLEVSNKDVRMGILGDDSVVCFPDVVNVSVFNATLTNLWGLIIKPRSDLCGPFDSGETETSIPFLGVRWPLGQPARSWDDWLKVSLFPKRNSNEYWKQAARKKYMSSVPNGDPVIFDWFWDYFSWAYKKSGAENAAGITEFWLKTLKPQSYAESYNMWHSTFEQGKSVFSYDPATSIQPLDPLVKKAVINGVPHAALSKRKVLVGALNRALKKIQDTPRTVNRFMTRMRTGVTFW